MVYKLKGIKNVYQFVREEEYQIQDYDFGCVFPEFCLLWKDGKKISSKFIKQFLKIQKEIEKIDKEKKQIKSTQNKRRLK